MVLYTNDGRSRKELNSGINQSKLAFNVKTFKLLSDRLLRLYVWSVTLYDCENTVRIEEKKRII